MELKKIHWTGIGFGLAIIIISLFFMGTRFFFFLIGLGFLILASPFVFSLIYETKAAAEKEDMFLEFARNLVESVKTGTPINKAIVNVRNKPYGLLSENVKKLANQITLGIPLSRALQTFAHDINNPTISRALTLIGQAERSGGEIGGILESVTEAVSMVDKLRKERKATISSMIIQGYIIFFVFIVIILVLQFQILPSLINIVPAGEGLSEAGLGGLGGLGGGGSEPLNPEEITSSFVYLLLVQGLFTGLVIGKLAEGSIKAGVRHSFILIIIAFFVSTIANIIFGG
jgi:flagellar protein FlaJ